MDRFLTNGDVPCWYELSWKGPVGDPKLVIRIHSDFANDAKEIPTNAGAVRGFASKLTIFNSFSGKLGKDFGFGKSLKYLGAVDDFLEYEISTPVVKRFQKVPCSYCNGTGHDKEFNQSCLWCEKGAVPYYCL